MIRRLALPALELVMIGGAITAAVSATASQSTIDMAIAGMAALVAAQIHGLAESQARGRRFDAAMSGLRAAPPSNDAGGL